MKIKNLITVCFAAMLFTGCASSSCHKKDIPPSPKPPKVEVSAKPAKESIESASTNAVGISKSIDKISANVANAKAAVDDMVPIVAAGVQQGGEAAKVADAIDPLQATAAKNLDEANAEIAAQKKLIGELTTNLAMAKERVTVVEGDLTKLQGQITANNAEWQLKVDGMQKNMDDMAKEIAKMKADNDSFFVWMRYLIGLISVIAGCLAVVSIVALKSPTLAKICGGCAVGFPIALFVVEGIFKARVYVIPLTVACVIIGFIIAAWYAYRNRKNTLQLVTAFQHQKNAAWDDKNINAVTSVLDDSTLEDVKYIKENVIKYDKDGNIVSADGVVMPKPDPVVVAVPTDSIPK